MIGVFRYKGWKVFRIDIDGTSMDGSTWWVLAKNFDDAMFVFDGIFFWYEDGQYGYYEGISEINNFSCRALEHRDINNISFLESYIRDIVDSPNCLEDKDAYILAVTSL